MIAQCENEYPHVCPLHGQGSVPGHGGVFQEIFPYPMTLRLSVVNRRTRDGPISLNDTTQPVATEGRSPTMDREWLLQASGLGDDEVKTKLTGLTRMRKCL